MGLQCRMDVERETSSGFSCRSDDICSRNACIFSVHKSFSLLPREELRAPRLGENEKAVERQIWAVLPTHLLLRYLKCKSGATCSYSRLAVIVRAIVWLKKDAMEILKSVG